MDSPFVASAAPAPARSEAGERYVPGVCNISPVERAKRRQYGWAAAIAAVALGALLIVIGAPHLVRLAVALPAAGSAVGFLQAHRHFCVWFVGRSITDLTADGETVSVDAEASRRADRRASDRLVRDAALIGLAIGAAFALSPI